jgi:isopenicillin N synthase-like dioxygenase
VIPVIDIKPLLDPVASPDLRRGTAREIREACLNTGFFHVVNHGVPEVHRQRLFAEMRAFFALPLERKMEIFIGKSEHFRGYIPLGGEVTGGRRDWHESIDFRSEFPADHPNVQAGKPLHGPNQWPEHPKALRSVLEEHWSLMVGIGQSLTGALALGLGLDQDFLDCFVDEPFCNMRILHYPVPDETDQSIGDGIGPHIDYGFLTILDQDDRGGLEVMDTRGEWVTAEHVPGAYLINIGRVTQIWTNDLYRATQHRVRRVARERFSVPFFFNPSFDALIEPLEICCSPDNPPRYDAYCHGEFMAERFQRSFGANCTAIQAE